MNMFNRLAMIIILLGTIVAIIFGILLVLLVPGQLAPYFSAVGTILALARTDPRLTETQLYGTLIALVVFVPALVLLWLEVRRTTRDSIRINQINGGEAHLSIQAVAQSLIYYVDALPGVVRVRPRLAAQGQTVNVRLDVETTPDVDVRAKTQEITQTARAVVEQKLGLKLRRLYIHLHHSANPRNAPLPPLMPEPLQTVKLESLQPLARSMSPEPAPRGMLPEPLVAADATPERPAEK